MGQYEVESITFDTETDLNNYLGRCDFALKLGSEEYVQSFDCMIISCSGIPTRYGIGIYSSTASAEPVALLLPDKPRVLLGFNESVLAVAVPKGGILFDVRLPSSFYTMIQLQSMDAVLVVHELGVVMMSYDGAKLWAFDGSDVLEEWSLDDDKLSLSYMEGNKVKLDLFSGALA